MTTVTPDLSLGQSLDKCPATQAALSTGANVLLTGYFGFQNAGDDLTLAAALAQLARIRPDLQLTLSERNPTSFGVPAASHRIAGVGPVSKLKRIQAGLKADAVAWVGGTCLYERVGHSGFGALERRVALLRMMGKPFHFVNIGIGSIWSADGERRLRSILANCASASFRDEASLTCAMALCPEHEKFHAGGDLVTLIDLPPAPPTDGKLRVIGFSGVREFAHDPITVRWLAACLGELIRAGTEIHFFAFHAGDGDESDHVLSRKVAALLPTQCVKVVECDTCDALVKALSKVDFHIGMRLHSVIASDMLGIPGVGIAATGKVLRYLRKVEGGDRCLPVGSRISADAVSSIFHSYRRPSAALAEERNSAIAGLNALLARPEW